MKIWTKSDKVSPKGVNDFYWNIGLVLVGGCKEGNNKIWTNSE